MIKVSFNDPWMLVVQASSYIFSLTTGWNFLFGGPLSKLFKDFKSTNNSGCNDNTFFFKSCQK